MKILKEKLNEKIICSLQLQAGWGARGWPRVAQSGPGWPVWAAAMGGVLGGACGAARYPLACPQVARNALSP